MMLEKRKSKIYLEVFYISVLPLISLCKFKEIYIMCGIIGFTGNLQAPGILVDGLQQLEYRGYDSAGIAVNNGSETLFLFLHFGNTFFRAFFNLLNLLL